MEQISAAPSRETHTASRAMREPDPSCASPNLFIWIGSDQSTCVVDLSAARKITQGCQATFPLRFTTAAPDLRSELTRNKFDSRCAPSTSSCPSSKTFAFCPCPCKSTRNANSLEKMRFALRRSCSVFHHCFCRDYLSWSSFLGASQGQ